MKTNLNLTIPRPCTEKWQSFTPSSTGGFCSSCSKSVTDFTRMSDEAIMSYFAGKPAHTCGRFLPHQLTTYQTKLTINPGMTLLKAGLMGLVLLTLTRPATAQVTDTRSKTEIVQQHTAYNASANSIGEAQTIKGVLKYADDNTPLPGVNIYLKGFNEGTVSDAQGNFEFPRKLYEGDVLVFSFIGLETQEYTVPKKSSGDVAINMTFSATEMMGEVAFDEPLRTEKGLRGFWSKVKAIF